MAWQKMTSEERFWCRVDKRGDDECWPWLPTKDTDKYGNFQINGKVVLAHRFSFTLHKGPIPEGKDVCHSCDWPPCQNPGHLFAGTHGDNMRDMCRKGRHNHFYGSASPHAVFTEDDVRSIKTARRNGSTPKELGAQYGKHPAHISMICTGRIWKHVV